MTPQTGHVLNHLPLRTQYFSCHSCHAGWHYHPSSHPSWGNIRAILYALLLLISHIQLVTLPVPPITDLLNKVPCPFLLSLPSSRHLNLAHKAFQRCTTLPWQFPPHSFPRHGKLWLSGPFNPPYSCRPGSRSPAQPTWSLFAWTSSWSSMAVWHFGAGALHQQCEILPYSVTPLSQNRVVSH